jgi:hypothetical protein
MDAPLVLAAWDIHSKIRKETVMEEPFSPPDWCVDGKKNELREPPVTLF